VLKGRNALVIGVFLGYTLELNEGIRVSGEKVRSEILTEVAEIRWVRGQFLVWTRLKPRPYS
jgi:hypothetical protein